MDLDQKSQLDLYLLFIIILPLLCALFTIVISFVIYKTIKNIFSSTMLYVSLFLTVPLIRLSIISRNNAIDSLEKCDYDGWAFICCLLGIPISLTGLYVLFGLILFLFICIIRLIFSPIKEKMNLIILCLFFLIILILFALSSYCDILFYVFTE